MLNTLNEYTLFTEKLLSFLFMLFSMKTHIIQNIMNFALNQLP